jgi:hypothetical protein
MCNAKRHSPACNCGFGPPYSVPYHITSRTPWTEEALDDQDFAERSLWHAGWDPHAIQAFAQRLSAVQHSQLPRSTMIERVQELVGMRQRRVISSETETVDVPLYRFAAPPVPGAKVEYIEGEADARTSSWILRFLGVGISDTSTVEIAKSRTFTATNGIAKLVFVPVLVRVSTIAIFDGAREVGRGHEAVVVPPPETGDPRLLKRGVRSATSLDVPVNTQVHESLDLDVRGDTSGDVHKDRRSWTMDAGVELSISLKPLVDISALVKVKRLRKLELAFELPAGHQYVARLGQGFTLWDSPAPAPRPRRARRAA